MKTTITTFITAFLLFTLTGCQPQLEKAQPLTEGKILLAVDFEQGKTLRYKFVSHRDLEVHWGAIKDESTKGKGKVDKTFEIVEMVVAYTPIKVDPYDLTTIEATCESVKVKQSTPTGRQAGRKDAVETFKGKTFTFTINATGEMKDRLQLEELIKEAGKKAFRPKGKKGKIKEPDMISDFTATQWFLWDPISSIEKPVEGLEIGQTWKSQLLVPVTMVLRQARNVTYSLDEIRQSEKGQLAVIRSTYSPAIKTPIEWPKPYTGIFQMSGRFGFLRGYKVLSLEGKGEELFNIDKGRIEQYNHQYEMQLRSTLPMGLSGIVPITVKQKLTMELLED